MREIKFRGKRKDNGEWIEGSLCRLAGLYFISTYPVGAGFEKNTNEKIITNWLEVKKSTVGQFTGRKLLSNKLCAGDILECYSELSDEQIKRNGVVVWHDGDAGWAVDFGDVVLPLAQVMSNYRCRIIGNKHDNPELLE